MVRRVGSGSRVVRGVMTAGGRVVRARVEMARVEMARVEMARAVRVVVMVRRVGSGSRVVRAAMTAEVRVGSGSRVVRAAMIAGARVVKVVVMVRHVGSGSRVVRVAMIAGARAVRGHVGMARVVMARVVMVARRVGTIVVRTFHKLRPSVVVPRCLHERVRGSTERTSRLAIAPIVKSASSMKAPFGAASSIPTNVHVETVPGASRAVMASKMGRCFQHHLRYRNPWQVKFDARSVTVAMCS
jgi:hypothetical protein